MSTAAELPIRPLPRSRAKSDVVADPGAAALGRGPGRRRVDVALARAGHVALTVRRGTLWLEADARPGPRRPQVAVAVVTRHGDDVYTQSAAVLDTLADTVAAAGDAHADVVEQLRGQAGHLRRGGRASWSPLAGRLPVGSGDGFFKRLLNDIALLP